MSRAVDIGICTFRRAHLADTLRSIAKLALPPDFVLRVIVADNDDTLSAQALVDAAASELSLPVTYVHAPSRNISVARNACLDAALAPMLAFVDDDEIVSPQWLTELIVTLEEEGADAVLGPVKAVYAADTPAWIRNGDFHSTRPVWVQGRILTGYAGNALINLRSPAFQGLRFRTDLGRTGGEDTAYFCAAVKAGARIAYAPDAVAHEAIGKSRATLEWLLKRRFRSGQTHGLMLLEESSPRAAHVAKAAAKAAFCALLAIVNVWRPSRMRFWALRGVMHIGVISRLLGQKEVRLYG